MVPLSRGYAKDLDENDELKHFREEFIIPSKADLKSKTVDASRRWSSGVSGVTQLMSSADQGHSDQESCIYLCGHSLGLQPKRTAERIRLHLAAWAQKGVYGHFTAHSNSPEPPFLHSDDAAARKMAPIVGALHGEVAVMETLTANLHFMMAAFYRPTKDKYKILIESKAFPSDHVRVDLHTCIVYDQIVVSAIGVSPHP
jgi:kynureninase